MITKTMQVFYDTLCLPYKDKDRTVHFPVVGGAFQGASNTTQIKFYVDEMGQANATWVAMAKLPNGKIGSKVLSTYLDSELNENYALLELDSWFTQAKGDVYISLQGFEGGVQLTYNSETELYEVNGTPVIQGTGSVKVNIMYATQFSGDTNMSIDISDILALAGDKLDTDKGIVVIANTSANVSGYEDNQIFYCLADNSFYKKVSGALTQIFTAYSKTESDNKYFINASNNTASGTNTFSGQNTFSGRAVFSGNANLYNTYLTTNTKNYFARVGTTTSQYVMYKLPYSYSDLGSEATYTLITKEYVDSELLLKADKSDTYTKTETDTLLNNKVDKTNLTYKIYATTSVGEQTKLTYSVSNSGATIPLRNGDGNIAVAETPTLNTHATSKKYVDNAIASAVSSAYIYKGTKTVAEINALDTSGLVVGWVYNVSDSGTITLGSLSVNAGDNIAWTGSAWDILAGVVDLSDYYTKTQVDTLLGGKQDTIDSSHKLSADLVDDTSTTNKFVSASDISNWNGMTPQTRTIATLPLSSDISAQDLTDKLVFMNNTTDLDYVMED